MSKIRTLFSSPKIRAFFKKIRLPAMMAGLIITLLIVFFWNTIVITIFPGHRGVLFSRLFGGTDLKQVYGEGVHLKIPWDRIYIYDTRIQEHKLELSVLAKDGLVVKVYVSTRYQVLKELLPQLHVGVGLNYLEKIIIPSITSAVRQTIGQYRPGELYSTARQELQDQMLVEAITEVSRVPIILHSIIVKRLELPPMLNEAIDRKLVAEQEYLRYQFLLKSSVQEAKRKTIDGYGIKKYQELVNINMTNDFLRFKGIEATRELAASNNAKLVVVGGGKDGLPIILNSADTQPMGAVTQEPMKPDDKVPPNAEFDQAVEDLMKQQPDKEEAFEEKSLFDKLKYFDQLLLNPMQGENR